MWHEIRGFLSGKRSKDEAKGRLHLVLAHDRAGLDGARLQDMRSEIAQVIGRYVDIDVEAVEIHIERVQREGTELRVSSPLRARS
ncbi:MAG TPA: cell division topological specificity factor MinE [Kofleriaceae bacterium]|nr:cell division topological specificity factor MinE [Kofleriaceae bacterium]